MKIVCINGSPKAKDSTSEYLLNEVSRMLGEGHRITHLKVTHNSENLHSKTLPWLDCDAIVIAFPLYVDAVPSHLIHWMVEMEPIFRELSNHPKLYVVVNCGFFESRQNRIAISVMKNWCIKSSLSWGMALGFGGGPMVRQAPMGKGPSKSFGLAYEKLVKSIKDKRTGEDIYASPNFPRFAYVFMANLGWVMMAKKNGVTKKEMF